MRVWGMHKRTASRIPPLDPAIAERVVAEWPAGSGDPLDRRRDGQGWRDQYQLGPADMARSPSAPHRMHQFKLSNDPFLSTIDANVPTKRPVHVIIDNYAARNHPAVMAWLSRHPSPPSNEGSKR
jgi:hypothetical protein